MTTFQYVLAIEIPEEFVNLNVIISSHDFTLLINLQEHM